MIFNTRSQNGNMYAYICSLTHINASSSLNKIPLKRYIPKKNRLWSIGSIHLIYTVWCHFVLLIRCEFIDCTGTQSASDPCYGNIVTCSSGPCVANCADWSACENKTINCFDGYLCNILGSSWADGTQSVRNAKINCPNNADCILNNSRGTNSIDTFLGANIQCGINGSCYFLFGDDAQYQGSDMHMFDLFNATHSKYLKIQKTNPVSESVVSKIYCPNNGYNGYPSCDIECKYYSTACDQMKIYAREGFSDVNITVYDITNTTFDNSFIFCGGDPYNYNISCVIDPNTPNQCLESGVSSDDELTCDNYLLPTMLPTVSTYPTSLPSNEPSEIPSYIQTLNTSIRNDATIGNTKYNITIDITNSNISIETSTTALGTAHSDSSGDKNTIEFDRTVLIVIILCTALVITVLIMLVFVMCCFWMKEKEKHKNIDQQQAEIVTANIHRAKSIEIIQPGNNIGSINNNTSINSNATATDMHQTHVQLPPQPIVQMAIKSTFNSVNNIGVDDDAEGETGTEFPTTAGDDNLGTNDYDNASDDILYADDKTHADEGKSRLNSSK